MTDHPFNTFTCPDGHVNTTPRPDGHVNHGGPILDRHDYRDWVEWPEGRGIPEGTRVRQEWVMGVRFPTGPRRTYVHPDDVPTDPDAELVEALSKVVLDPEMARAALRVLREHEAKR